MEMLSKNGLVLILASSHKVEVIGQGCVKVNEMLLKLLITL